MTRDTIPAPPPSGPQLPEMVREELARLRKERDHLRALARIRTKQRDNALVRVHELELELDDARTEI